MIRILVVDDEKSIRVTFKEILSGAGYEVHLAENADETISVLKLQPIDVVLADIILPGMSNVEILQIIYDLTPYLEVILMTGKPTLETAAKAVRLGAFDYLMKPISQNTLLNNVANAVKYKKNRDEHRRVRKEQDLLAHQNKMLLESAGVGIYGLDLNGNTTFCNPAALKMIKRKINDVLGKPKHAILHHSKPDGTPYPVEKCPISAAFKDGKGYHRDSEVFCKKDGTSFPVEYISRPILEDGQVKGTVVTFKDITQRKQQENKILKINAELKNRAKERTRELEIKNQALLEVLKLIDVEKKQMQKNVKCNSEKLLIPLIKKLKMKEESAEKRVYDVLENNLKKLTSDFGVKISDDRFKLTPREIGICDLIKSGLESKDISQFLNVSTRTIETHRKNIRKKLRLHNKNVNLVSYLQSL